MKNRIELERNEMSEILAQNFALNDQKFDASDFEWSAHCLQMAGFHKTEWISVEERLPEEKMNCLVHYKHAYCDNDGYWSIGVSFYDGHKFHIRLAYKITHWMPLPMPPKGDVGK